jgi:RNA polymerase sigma-70 factor (ECF subfamily)
MTDEQEDLDQPGAVQLGPAFGAEQFLAHFAQHHQRILAYIFSLLHNEQDAQDVFQKTSLILWRKYEQFEPESDFLAWACGVAYYEVRNFFRVAGRSRLRFNDELLRTLADQRQTQHERSNRRAAALGQCVERLSPSDRQLVDQAYGGQQSIQQLAEQLGRAVQTIYNRLNLIRRRLFECVERSLAEQGHEQ